MSRFPSPSMVPQGVNVTSGLLGRALGTSGTFRHNPLNGYHGAAPSSLPGNSRPALEKRPPRSVGRWIEMIALAAIIIGVALRVTHLSDRVLFYDEAVTQLRVSGHTERELMRSHYNGTTVSAAELRQYTIVSSESSWRGVISSLAHEDALHPPLFYLVEYSFVKLAGNALWAWRVLPATFGLCLIPIAFALSRELFGSTRIALFAAALCAVSPIEVIYSHQAREYSLLTSFVLLSTLAIVRACRANRLWQWLSYALILSAGLYTSPLMGYVAAAHMIACLSYQRRPSCTAMCLGALAAALAAYTPWLVEIYAGRHQIEDTNAWSTLPWPISRMLVKWVFNTGATYFDLEYDNLCWMPAFALCALIAIFAIVRGFRKADPQARWFLGATIFVPALILIVPDLLLSHHRSCIARYELPICVMLSVVAARGIADRAAYASMLLGASACASIVGSQSLTWWDNDANADDRLIAAIINSVPRAQIMTSSPPTAFLTLAQLLKSDTRVTLSTHPIVSQLSPRAELFVVGADEKYLSTLRRTTRLILAPVHFSHKAAAYEVRRRLGGNETVIDRPVLYRSLRGSDGQPGPISCKSLHGPGPAAARSGPLRDGTIAPTGLSRARPIIVGMSLARLS